MAFRLRYLAHDLELPVGDFVVGRSTECQLSLDDPLVSRRHGLLRVTKEGVTVQDLGSRNGVLVNGAKIAGERELQPGDKVGIGSQEMVLHVAADVPASAVGNEEVYRRATQTLGAAYVLDVRNQVEGSQAGGAQIIRPSSPSNPSAATDPPTAEGSRSLQSFVLLGGVADKALAMGKAEDAERILQALLNDVGSRVREGQTLESSVAEAACKYAARIGGATTKGVWFDYVFEVYGKLGRVLPAPVIDELYAVVRKVKNADLAKVRAYLDVLRAQATSFGPAERFLVQRIEGLERQVALK